MNLKSLRNLIVFSLSLMLMSSCGGNQNGSKGPLGGGDAAQKAYVAPGEFDEFYAFLSGGFSGQVSVYGLPSGRLLKVIPVFSVDAEKAWGFNEETKPMLETSHGFIPWDDAHHPELSQTERGPRWALVLYQWQQYTTHCTNRPDNI